VVGQRYPSIHSIARFTTEVEYSVYAPSEIPFADDYPMPKAMTEADIQYAEDAFVAAVKRAEKAGFDFIELHSAHGYLLTEFLSPLSNTRTDSYGGQSLENRMRFPLRVFKRIREAWPDKPLFVRLSGTEWAEGPEKDENGLWRYWGIEQSTIFSGELKALGVDLVHMSSGGNWSKQKIDLKPGYQVRIDRLSTEPIYVVLKPLLG
jgi:2,4-dienoyl-CoA reductase-like NADH-dependent reductase (Old Yellow Enzyme family)